MKSQTNSTVAMFRKKTDINDSRPVIANRELKNIATLIFKQLQTEGCKTNDIINISSEILELVTNDIAQPMVANSK